MQPTIGRVVHYQAYGTPNGEYPTTARAAIVTSVEKRPVDSYPDQDEEELFIVGLAVLNPSGIFFNQDVPYSAAVRPGHWNWPPRV